MVESNERALIGNLKGRVSKMLSISTQITQEERNGLEGIYRAIDSLLLSKREQADIETFKEELKFNFGFIKQTKKSYIRAHIVPLVNKISTSKWENNG